MHQKCIDQGHLVNKILVGTYLILDRKRFKSVSKGYVAQPRVGAAAAQCSVVFPLFVIQSLLLVHLDDDLSKLVI